MRQKAFSPILAILLTFSLLLSSCAKPPASSPSAPPRGITGTITTGKETTAATGSISPSGGSIAVTDPASPLKGLEITVPPNSYSNATPFKVSYSPVEKHTFGDNFNPISPMITVDNGGGYSEEIMEVKIPVKVPEGQFAMGFLYDDKTKKLEGLPLAAQDESSITVTTRHFSNLIVSIIDMAKLNLDIDKDIDSGFRPGVDDWQFVNRGSYIEQSGHCAGQSLAAMWYYITRPDGKDVSLYGRYDNNGSKPATPNFQEDDSFGYRFSSVVQHDADWEKLSVKVTRETLSEYPETTLRLFAYSMLLTGEPQYVSVRHTLTLPESGHALVVYRVSAGKLYVSDPNYPGKTDRFIEYANGTFIPYSSGANAEEIAAGRGKQYNRIAYIAKTSLIDWAKISTRWAELRNGTIGNDVFPAYEIHWVDEQNARHKLEDGYVSPVKLLKLHADTDVPGRWYLWRNVTEMISPPDVRDPNWSGWELRPGNNLLGIEIDGIGANNTKRYIDFKYFNVVYHGLRYGNAQTFADGPQNINYANTATDKMSPNYANAAAKMSRVFRITTSPEPIWRYEAWIALAQPGSWVEAVTTSPTDTVGVQFWGDQNDGWARVLVDGKEVWTGDTYGSDGMWPGNAFVNYLEITGLSFTNHTVRVEHMGKDGGGGGNHVSVFFFGWGKKK